MISLPILQALRLCVQHQINNAQSGKKKDQDAAQTIGSRTSPKGILLVLGDDDEVEPSTFSILYLMQAEEACQGTVSAKSTLRLPK